MVSKLLRISDNGWRSLSALRDSIKLLFDVDMTLKEDTYHDGGQKVEVEEIVGYLESENFEDYYTSGNDPSHRFLLLETNSSSSPENIEKAQKYSCACFPSNPKFKIITLKVNNSHIFEMVHHQSTHIQQSTASLLKFIPERLEIILQGDESCVELARERVEMILDDPISKDLLKQVVSSSNEDEQQQTTPSHYESDSLSPSRESALQERLHGDHVIHLFQDGLVSHDQSDCYIEADSDISQNVQGDNNNPMPFNMSSLHAQRSTLHQKLSTSSSSAVESDDDNSHVTSAVTDSRNTRLVEQAAKLGYSVNQIEIALGKLDPGCSSNDLVSELIKIGNEQPEVKSSAGGLGDHLRMPFLFNNLSRDPGSQRRSRPAPPSVVNLDHSDNLRSIVIDGSNVAMSHGQDKFSCKGILIAVDWFRKRGHTDITVFVPKWRKEASRPDAPIEDQQILLELERERILSFTPARRIGGRRVVSYDDRYILKHAIEVDGIVVSNDVYRDLVKESEEFQKIVDQRLLMYSFVKDKFMPPDDPLGRMGPSLDNFLRKKPSEPAPKPQDCPYGKKCTYGNKCRFYHPERGFASQKSISDTLKEQANINLQEIAQKKSESTLEKSKRQKQKLARTKSLVPVESLCSTYASEIQCDGGIRVKPRLTHSQSLVAQMKTGEYLTESRLKLEAAESVENSQSQRFSPLGKDVKTQMDFAPVSPKAQNRRTGSADIVHSYSPSPRVSPVPPREDTLVEGMSVMTFSPTSKLDHVAMSLAHLAVPSSHPQPAQESYSSGHLSVAKKLSDEGSEKCFFEGSRSTPSPPSSLLEDISSFKEKKPVVQTQMKSKHNCPPENLVATIKETNAQKNAAKPTEVEYQSGCFNNVFPYEQSPHTSHPCNVDSGNFSMYDSPQPQMNPQAFCSFPTTKTNSLNYSRQNLHRSLSSSHNMKGRDSAPRRASEISTKEAYKHTRLQPQQCNPLHSHYQNQVQGPHVGSLQRQNSSSNPEIYARSEIFDSRNGEDSRCGMYRSAPLPGVNDGNPPVQEQQTQHFVSQPQMPAHPMNLPYSDDQYYVGHVSEMPNVGKPVLPSDVHGNYVFPSYSMVGQPGRIAESGFQHQLSQGFHRPAMPMHPPPQSHYYPYHTQQANSPSFYGAEVVTSHSHYQVPAVFQGQNIRSYEYPMCQGQGMYPPSSVPQPQYRPDYPQVSLSGATTRQSITVDPDADISPQDGRYDTYYHLSTVYGEKVVRNFMNRNPDVKDINQLINLIGAYKVETGM